MCEILLSLWVIQPWHALLWYQMHFFRDQEPSLHSEGWCTRRFNVILWPKDSDMISIETNLDANPLSFTHWLGLTPLTLGLDFTLQICSGFFPIYLSVSLTQQDSKLWNETLSILLWIPLTWWRLLLIKIRKTEWILQVSLCLHIGFKT